MQRVGVEVKYIMKWKHVSCEIEDFVEVHLCKLREILRARVLRVIYAAVAVNTCH